MTKHYVVIANGDFLAPNILNEVAQGKIIIVLDGAANKLTRLGIMPHIILGDFDSINLTTCNKFGIRKTFAELTEDDQAYQGNRGTLIVPAKDQRYTDLEKALNYCDQQGAVQIDVVCAMGGRLDHHENALQCLYRNYKADRIILLHTEQQTLRLIRNETISICGEITDNCAIFAFPKGKVTSQGLLYELNDFPLIFGISNSIANSFRIKQVKVKVVGHALIFMPPQLESQRKFPRKKTNDRS